MTEKQKVLIVDEEFRIGILIKKLIHWDELGMECQDVLDNGEKAFEVIKKSRPDIVITDVRMPKISGLDLLKMVRDEGIQSQFIIISGYKEFEYARQAMSMGVEFYLLKPVNEKDLNENLKKVKEKICLQAHQEFVKEEMKKKADESDKIIRRAFMKKIIEEKESELEGGVICLNGEKIRGVDIKLDCMDLNHFDSEEEKVLVKKVCSIIDTFLREGEKLNDFLIYEKKSMHIYCLLNYDEVQKKEVRDTVGELLLKIKDYLMGYDLYEVTIGIGEEKNTIEEAGISLIESYRAVCNRMFLGIGRIIYMDHIPESLTGEIINRYKENKRNITESVEGVNKEKLLGSISNIFAEPMKEAVDASEYFEVAEMLIENFFKEINKEEFFSTEEKLKIQCQHCFKLAGLQELLEKRLSEYIDILQEQENGKNTKPIRLAKQYVEEHYREKILLEDVAKVVDLNPVYFSVIFKEKTGMNFSAYLIYIRMEKAKKLLINSNETIAAIGDAVGYSDQKYFSQLFKKNVGIKPTIYRKLYS
jgi:two-component system, response regulator YesN